MKITIETIKHKDQKYNTIGDYHENEYGNIFIVVSEMPDENHALLVGIHELIEVVLMRKAGIPLQASTDYDIPFEQARLTCDPWERQTTFEHNGITYPENAEPGDAPDCPYQREHNFATAVERMLCAAFGIKWATYEDAVNELFS